MDDMTAIDTGTDDLRAEIDSGVAVITMNRPERRNAFSQAMVSAMGTVLAQVETDEAVGCVVLTGAAGAFSAGGDVKSMAARSDDGNGSGLAGARGPPAAACGACPSRPSPPSPGPRPAPACPWHWPATCATRCRGPS